MPFPFFANSNIQMFWWLKPKFYSKCISYANSIKMRLETIKNRKRAMEKFMKNDIAELLRRGLDHDAYKRTEGLIFEQNMLTCYELIEMFIGCISNHLEDLTKQSDCPDECKEAVASLIYAAARVSDLPELRKLRTLFTEKFGNSLESHISKELVEKLRSDPHPREMKIRLLYDIAQEFSIEWDSKALKIRSLNDEKPKVDNKDNLVTIGGEHIEGSDYNASKEKERETITLGRKNFNFNKDLLRNQYSSEDETNTETSSNHNRKGSYSSFGSISEDEEVETKKPNSLWLIPPPYLKQKNNKSEGNLKKTTDSEALQKKKTTNSETYPSQQQQLEYDTGENRRRKTSHVRGTSLPTLPTTLEETSPKEITRTSSLDQQTRGGAWHVHPSLPDYDDFIARLKALTGRKNFNFNKDLLRNQYSSEDETNTETSSNHNRKGSYSSFGSISEDEEVETKKPNSLWLIPPPYLKQKNNKGEGNLKKTTDSEALQKKKTINSETYLSQQQLEYDTGENRRRKTSHVRGTSLPTLPTTLEETSTKEITRTSSLDQQTRGGAWHVHPSLPEDYDDFIARFKALTGRS